MRDKLKPALHDWELAKILEEIQAAASQDKQKARALIRGTIKRLGREFDLVTHKGVFRMRLNRRFLASFVKIKPWKH
jgi:hypothetical protein